MKFVETLKKRWGIQSTLQILVILIVFSFTGFSLLFIKSPLYQLIGIDEQTPVWIKIAFFALGLLPIYNLLLLGWGFLFGQFRFFWNFEKRMFKRVVKIFNP